jgi:hypothetical protein
MDTFGIIVCCFIGMGSSQIGWVDPKKVCTGRNPSLTVWFGLVRDVWYSCRLAHVTRCSARAGGLRGAFVFALALALGPETVAREGVRLAAFARFVGWEG